MRSSVCGAVSPPTALFGYLHLHEIPELPLLTTPRIALNRLFGLLLGELHMPFRPREQFIESDDLGMGQVSTEELALSSIGPPAEPSSWLCDPTTR